MTWAEWEKSPWHEQAAILEGLVREELYNPSDYYGGDVDEDLDGLGAQGFHVEVERM